MPGWKQEILKRLAPLKLAPAREAAMVEELAQHMEERYQELVSAGKSEENARQAVLHELSEEKILALKLAGVEKPGDPEPLGLETKGSGRFISSFAQDLRYGLRLLAKTPAFTSVAVLTLALGIGANAAVFSVLHAVLLRPLPYRDPDQILMIYGRALNTGNFEEWRQQSQSFAQFAATSLGIVELTGVAEPERLRTMPVSAEFFPLLEIRPALGRPFELQDFQPGSPRVVIVSDGFWRRWLNMSSNAVGKTLILDRAPYAVAGIMPPDPGPLPYHDIDIWLPLLPGRAMGTSALGRLKSRATLETARAEAETIAQRLANKSAREGQGLVHVDRLENFLVEDSETTLLLLAGSVGFVLLIACANVANLLLVRLAGREREIAVRTALGASRARIIRQLFAEGMLLSFAGATGGLLAARGVTRILILRIPYYVPRIGESKIDGAVFAFALITAVATCLLFSTAPALASLRLDPTEGLKEGTRGEMRGAGHRWLRGALVVLEVALAMVMLTGAGLLVKVFLVLEPSDPGFDPDQKLTMRLFIPMDKYPQAAQRIALMREVAERLQAIPNVRGVAAVSDLPMTGMSYSLNISIGGQEVAGPGHGVYVHYRACSPNYFHLMGQPVVAGRDLSTSDDENAPKVAIVNQTMARRFWPDKQAVGQRVGVELGGQPVEFTVIGIVRDARIFWETTSARPELYVPFWQDPAPRTSLVISTTGDPNEDIGPVRDALHSLEPDAIVSDVQTMDQLLYDSVASPRFNAHLFGILAGLALVLALVGIYGVLSYLNSQRTHEFGVRLALGAERHHLFGLVLEQGMKMVCVGVLLGLVGAFALTRLLQSILFQVSPLDPLTYSMVTAMLLVVALAACFIPARRAAKVDPMVALRYE